MTASIDRREFLGRSAVAGAALLVVSQASCRDDDGPDDGEATGADCARDRRYLVDAEGTEPRWRSRTELVYLVHVSGAARTGSSFYRIQIDPSSGSPVGKRELIIRDPRFADTPGWSHATTADGDLIYLQSPDENLGYYLRIVPGWVDQMKRAVDAANR